MEPREVSRGRGRSRLGRESARKMDRLRTFFGYKSLDDANLCAKEPVDLKQDENAYVREMIHRATSDMLMGSDWALNMEVVDFVNRSDAKIKESVACTLSNCLMEI